MNEENQTQVINWDVNKAAIAEVAEDLKDVDAYVDLPAAKAAKKRLTKMRTALGEAHKETKAEALEFGRKVDAKKNEYLALIRKIEDPISDQLTDIKLAAERKEVDRINAITAQIERVSAYAMDRHSLTLAELIERRTNLLEMELDPDDFEEFGEQAKLAYDEAELKLRLAIDREETHLEEEAKNAAIEEENRKLREQLARAEADAETQRRKEQDERLEREAEAKKVKDEEDRVAREKQDAEDAEKQAEFDRVAKEQEEERARLDKELLEREAEEARVADEKRRAEQAPDADKLLALAAAIDCLELPQLTSDLGNEILFETRSALTELVYDIREKTEGLK